MAQKQQNSPSQGAGFSGFPTRHPMSGNSNVLLAGVNLDNREYVIPTMVGGEKLSMNDAIRVARNHGLDHYPSFNSVTEASQWAETNHGNISADGKLNPTTQNNTNIMAQNTFRQDLMSNAQSKPVWEQPFPTQAPTPTQAPPAMLGPDSNPRLSIKTADFLYNQWENQEAMAKRREAREARERLDAAPTPTQAPPAMAAPASNQAPLTMKEMTEPGGFQGQGEFGYIKPEYQIDPDREQGRAPIVTALAEAGMGDTKSGSDFLRQLQASAVPYQPTLEGPNNPTDEQWQSMKASAAPQAAPVQMPPTTQAQVDARTAARGGNGQGEVPSLSDDIGQTLKGMFVDPLVSLGEGIGEWAGAQKYGTGISAEGEATGHPIARPSLLGDIATLPGTALNVAGLVTDPAQAAWNAASDLGERQVDLMKKGVDYVTGQTATPSTPNQPTVVLPTQQAPSVDMGSEVAAEPAPEPAIKPQSAVQLDPNSPQANFLREKEKLGGQPMNDEQIAQATRLAASMGTTFDPETGYSRQPFLDAQSTPQQGVQQGSGLTTVGGAPLNEFLSGAAMPERGFARAENAMYGDNSLSRGLGGDAATKAFQDASAAREGRIEQNFGQARGPYSTDRGSGMSMEEATRLAGGDTALAKRMIELEKQGYDPVTEQPIKGTGSAKEDAEIGKIRAETAEILSQIGEKGTELNLSPAELARDKAAGTTLNKWDDSGRATIESNITSLNEVIGGLESGQIKTRGFIDALPFGADWARAIMNPTGQDAKDRVQGVIFQTLRETLGAQFTEKEGQRLVEASYNVKLSPEQNAARLRDYTTGLKRAAEARESQMRYLKENKTLSGYEGPTPSSVMSQVGAGGEGGSPIKGDIDYQSDIQSSATEIMNSK